LTYIQDPDPDPHSFEKLDPDPDPHSPEKLDPDPHKVNPDPKHCRNTYERNESHSLKNCHVKILVLEGESESGEKSEC
jgi:hypothetical protein